MCDLECSLVKKKSPGFRSSVSTFLLQDMSVCNPGHPVDYRCESEQYQ